MKQTLNFHLVSLLSDAQEYLNYSDTKNVNIRINFVKWVMINYSDKMNEEFTTTEINEKFYKEFDTINSAKNDF